MDNPKQVDDYKIPKWLFFYGAVGFGALVTAGSFYYHYFPGPILYDSTAWAQFGDYFGGILGALFGFLTFIGLLYTMISQGRELHLTRRDLQLTQEIAEDQKKVLELQRLESTFFRILDSQDSIRDRITFNNETGQKAFSSAIALVHKYQNRSLTLAELFAQTQPPLTELGYGRDGEPAMVHTAHGQYAFDITMAVTIQEKFRPYLATLKFLVNYIHKEPTLSRYAETYFTILRSRLPHIEEQFVIYFACNENEDPKSFPFFEIISRQPQEAEIKIPVGQAFQREAAAAFHPSMREALFSGR